jgi:arginine/lysine/ornithine decarboxylase
MSEHQFYDSLADFAAQKPLRLHMPGHKGKQMPMEEWNALSPLDFTELPPTGDLYEGDDWLEESQRLWAWDWGFDTAFYATGGSTQGILTLFHLFTRPGDTVLVDRVSHKSIHNAMALFDLHPIWLARPWAQNCAVTAPLLPETVEQALAEHPEARAVMVTSPTYYGVLTDLDAIAQICHRHGAKLLVDGAHGAHLPLVLPGEDNCLLGVNPYRGADGVTVSTHKTLAAPGQTAIIFANGVRMEQLREASALTSTTSPSFVMLAALDRLRGWMWEQKEVYRRVAQQCRALRKDYPTLPLADSLLDPCRLVLQVEDGYAYNRQLQALGIFAEMADQNHVVCILTSADEPCDFDRFRQGLNTLGLCGKNPFVCSLEAPPLPKLGMSPRDARFAPRRQTRLGTALGKIAAAPIAPYPPGVPVAAPGEVLDEKNLAYLHKLCYDEDSVILTVDEQAVSSVQTEKTPEVGEGSEVRL